ncbi:MAG: DNA repair protein RecN, partial [Hyphomicrobiales bacterium]
FALALGGRGDGGLVRHGQGQGQVSAVFDVALAHPARSILRANDIPDDGDLILRRVQVSDGRTRAFINDQPVSVQVLRQVGSALVEIHGQHDDRALVDPASHRQMLDAFAGLEADALAVAERHAGWRRATQALAQHRAKMEKARAEGDWLRHATEELRLLAAAPGEETSLAERRSTMMQAEKIAVDLKEAYEGVGGADAPGQALAGIIRRLERRGAQAPRLVEPAIAALDQALNALEEARIALEAAMRDAAFDPRELERVEERLFALRAASRKFDVPVDDLAALGDRYAGELAMLDAGEGQLTDLDRAEREAKSAYDSAAADLSERRRAAASALDAAVNAELGPLKLERARFITDIQTDRAMGGPEGFDRVEFWVQTNPGTRP